MNLAGSGDPSNTKGLINGFLGAMGFLTTLPAGRSDRLIQLQDHTYMFIPVGIIVGLIIGAVAAVLLTLIPHLPGLVAVLVIISIYLTTGFNHLDALSDFGDGITAHGSREKKIRALKDVALGTGGAAFIVLYLLMIFVIIQGLVTMLEIWDLAFALLVAEVASKHAMITTAWAGSPIYRGMGSMIADNTNVMQFLVGSILSVLVCTVILGTMGLMALAAAFVGSLLVVAISNRHFGGINGDCIGTSNEIGRLVTLMTILVLYQGGMAVWMPW